jgi:hypothetical protein
MSNIHYGSSVSYYWSRLAEAFLKHSPHLKWDLFKAVLTAGADEWSALSDVEMGERHLLTEILRSDPNQAWASIAAILVGFENLDASGIRHWLEHGGFHRTGDEVPGPIQYVPSALLFNWINVDRERRALWVADILPKTLDASTAGRLTRDFVANYCSDPHVANVLYCQFHCRGGWGNASDRYRTLRNEAQKWLVGEQDINVIRWTNRYIDGLSDEIKRAEIDEERRL